MIGFVAVANDAKAPSASAAAILFFDSITFVDELEDCNSLSFSNEGMLVPIM